MTAVQISPEAEIRLAEAAKNGNQPIVVNNANSKGGVGKTTQTEELAHRLAEQGKWVLVMDLDGQCNLTKNLDAMPTSPKQPTMHAVLTEPGMDAMRAVVQYTGTTSRPVRYANGGGLFLIPGAKTITKAPGEFFGTRARQPIHDFKLTIHHVITSWLMGFDFILLDSSPDPDSEVNDAALLATHEVLVPVSVESMSIDGVMEFLAILRASNASRPSFKLTGQAHLKALVPSKVMPDQVERAGEVIATLAQHNIPHFGDLYVPYTTAGWKAPDDRVPIALYRPDDAAALVYQQIAAKLL